MKKVYLLALALALPVQANAMDNESVYAWGKWAQNIQPAAGPVAAVTPSPVTQPTVNFRPNENTAFTRVASAAVITPSVVITPAPPVTPEAPQLPNIVIAPSDTPSSPIGDL